MATSEKKAAANRANAQRSTGPNTAKGKEISRGNALRHGMAANVVAAPGENQEELDALRTAFVGEIASASVVAAEFADRAFRALMRARRADRAADAALASRARRAKEVWEIERAAELQRAIDELDDRPGVAVARLKSTAEGASWLRLAWLTLDQNLDSGSWSIDNYNRAVSLLGIVEVGHPALFLASDHLADSVGLFREMGGSRTYLSVDDAYIVSKRERFNVDVAREIAAAARKAYAYVKKFIREQIEALEPLVAELAPLSQLDREDAESLVATDLSPEGRLADRYRAAADRELHKFHKAALEAEARAAATAEAEAPRPDPVVESPAPNEAKPTNPPEAVAPNEAKLSPSSPTRTPVGPPVEAFDSPPERLRPAV